uniref:THAP3 protein n=1 Tax=Fopius arisanus TaxID=64838 RepID=A0A0C9R8R7_9HYME
MRCVYCGKAKEKNKEISFHRFPKDEKLVKTWVMNMGRLDLVPKQWHMLCAEHFSKTCIDFRDLRARLRKGSVPTIFKHNKENFSLPSATELIVHVSKRELYTINRNLMEVQVDKKYPKRTYISRRQ